jgi:hypothetical protein
MKRIIRDRHLTAEEAAEYQEIRDQVAEELPDLIDRHQKRMNARNHFWQSKLDYKYFRDTAPGTIIGGALMGSVLGFGPSGSLVFALVGLAASVVAAWRKDA